jgi:hypothetical protein
MGLCSTDVPAAALGTTWERVSAPTGDNTDTLFFYPLSNTSYKIQMTSCSDISGYVGWQIPGQDSLPCGGSQVINNNAQINAAQLITVRFGVPPDNQIYDLYQFTVVQCLFANCGTS